MRYIYNGTPLAQQRHRMARGIVYDPQSSIKRKLKFDAASQIRQQGYLNALEGPISVRLDIRYPIPKSWLKKRQITENYKTSRPDVDNISKIYLDILNKIAYDDDSQIVSLYAQKRYSSKPGVSVSIFQLKEEE